MVQAAFLLKPLIYRINSLIVNNLVVAYAPL